MNPANCFGSLRRINPGGALQEALAKLKENHGKKSKQLVRPTRWGPARRGAF